MLFLIIIGILVVITIMLFCFTRLDFGQVLVIFLLGFMFTIIFSFFYVVYTWEPVEVETSQQKIELITIEDLDDPESFKDGRIYYVGTTESGERISSYVSVRSVKIFADLESTDTPYYTYEADVKRSDPEYAIYNTGELHIVK